MKHLLGSSLSVCGLVDAVGQCREVLQELEKGMSLKAPARQEWAGKDTNNRLISHGWSMDQRVEFVREAIEHATNVAHHREAGEISPAQARLLVEWTALLLKYYSGT